MHAVFGVLAVASLAALPLFSQPGATPYDCVISYTFTTATPQTGQPNNSRTTPCVGWRLTLNTTGFSSVTVEFDTSPDNSTWTVVPNTTCGNAPCVLDGASPIAAGTQGTAAYRAYGAFVRINPTSVTGSGTATVTAYGYKGTSVSGGSGGGNSPCTVSGTTITCNGVIVNTTLVPPLSTVASLPTGSIIIGPNQFSTQNFTLWNKSGGTVTGGQSDPLGGSNAYLFSEDSSSNNHYTYLSPTLTTGSQYVAAVWAKPANRLYYEIDFPFNGGDQFAVYTLTGSGSVSFTNTGIAATITAGTGAAAGWYYLTATATTSASVPYIIMAPFNQASPGGGYSYPGLNQASGYQFAPVVGLFVSSSGPTTGSMYEVTDGVNGQDCSVGGGSTRTFCIWNGSSWNPVDPPSGTFSALAFSSSNTATTASPLVYVGDSLTAGLHGAHPPSFYVSPTASFTQTNQGISGQTISTMSSTAAAKVFPLYTPLAQWNIVSVWGGINDIVTGSTATQTFSSLVSIHRQLHLAGFKTIVNTVTPCGLATCTSGQQTTIASLNTLIRSQWWTFGDYLADLNATANLTDPTNGTYYYTDQLHMVTAGYTIVGGVWQTAVNAITASTVPLTANTFATTTTCASSASPAVCGSAAAGAVAIPTGANPTLVVDTTAVTANSTITLTPDDSLTIAATTCNSTLATLIGGMAITARTAGTSFTISFNGTIATNPVCVSYLIVN